MCGIAGYKQRSNSLNETHLGMMVKSIDHRGPDANDVFISQDKKTALGHARLSILDLSEKANQPMKSACGRFHITYNGEVYNFAELRQEIQQQKIIQFRSDSDTEVILEAFGLWGKDFVHKLNGMFAFAIFDKESEELHLWRDRIGIKPLYYYYDDRLFAFASELKALLKIPHIDKRVDMQSVTTYLQLGFVARDRTIYANIKKLEPGNYLIVNREVKLNIYRYYELSDSILANSECNEQKALENISTLLRNSVKKRLVSDVPVGCFLSGGIDSSLISAIASEESGKPFKTFNIGFENAIFDETGYARKVAKELGTDHHEYILKEKEAIEILRDLLETFDEPFADSSAIPTMLVSRLARRDVKVILSGDGGDELFYGYGHYSWAKRLNNPWFLLIRPPLHSILKNSRKSRLIRVSELLESSDGLDIYSHIFSQEQYNYSYRQIRQLMKNPQSAFDFDKNQRYDRKLNAIEMQSQFDLLHYLPEDLLVKVDRSSMRFGLEVRVPFLDHELIEYVLNIDQRLKPVGKNGKYLLKKVLYQFFPAEYFDRPKWGFSIPLSKWLRNDLKGFVDTYLDEKLVSDLGIINPQYIDNLRNQYKLGKDYLYNRIWMTAVLHQWALKNL